MSNFRYFVSAIALWVSCSHAGRPEILDPLHMAVFRNDYKTVVKFLKTGVERINGDILRTAAKNGYIKIVRILLKHGADACAKDFHGNTPLSNATGRPKTMKLLLKHGADPTSLDGQGYNPFHHAVKRGFVQSVELLMSHDATLIHKPTADKRARYTPLHIASTTPKRTQMLRRLIAHGAFVDIFDKFNETPLHLAACTNNKKYIQFLLDHGADITAQSSQGNTILHAVCHRQRYWFDRDNALQTEKAKKTALFIIGYARAQGKENEMLSLKNLNGENAHDYAKNKGDDFLIPLVTDFQKTHPLINKVARKVALSHALKKHKICNIMQLLNNRELGILPHRF